MSNAVPNLDPWAVTRDATNSTGDGARDARYAIGALSQPAAGNSFAWADGVFPSAMNGALISDYQVTAQPTPGMAVNVNFGNAQIGRLNNGPYLGSSTGVQTATFGTSNPTNPRIDYVVIHTNDAGVETTPVQTWNIGVYAGTPAATPAEPSGQMTDNDVLIAAVTIRANTTQVLAGDISDRRVFVTARGGITPKSAIDTRVGAYVGQYRDNGASGALERWDGGTWTPVAQASVWTQWTPQLKYGGNAGTAGGTPGPTTANMGTGAQMLGSYNVTGKVITLSYSLGWGSPPYNMGTGMISTTLPPGWVHTPNGGPSVIPAWLQVNDTASGSFAFFWGAAIIFPSSSVVWPMFPFVDTLGLLPGTNTTVALPNGLGYYQAATTLGVPGHGCPVIPAGFPQGGTLFIQGTLEVV